MTTAKKILYKRVKRATVHDIGGDRYVRYADYQAALRVVYNREYYSKHIARKPRIGAACGECARLKAVCEDAESRATYATEQARRARLYALEVSKAHAPKTAAENFMLAAFAVVFSVAVVAIPLWLM